MKIFCLLIVSSVAPFSSSYGQKIDIEMNKVSLPDSLKRSCKLSYGMEQGFQLYFEDDRGKNPISLTTYLPSHVSPVQLQDFLKVGRFVVKKKDGDTYEISSFTPGLGGGNGASMQQNVVDGTKVAAAGKVGFWVGMAVGGPVGAAIGAGIGAGAAAQVAADDAHRRRFGNK